MKLTDSDGLINVYGLFAALFGMLAFVAAIVVPINAAVDVESWTPNGQGCYVHTYHNNHVFGKDVVTINTYCKESN